MVLKKFCLATTKNECAAQKGVAHPQNLLVVRAAPTGDVDGGKTPFAKGHLLSVHPFTTPGPELDAQALVEDCDSEKQPH